MCNSQWWAVALKGVTYEEDEEKKKLLSKVIFNTNGLSSDEPLVILQVLQKDEDQLTMFWDLPNDKNLCSCCLSNFPHSV